MTSCQGQRGRIARNTPNLERRRVRRRAGHHVAPPLWRHNNLRFRLSLTVYGQELPPPPSRPAEIQQTLRFGLRGVQSGRVVPGAWVTPPPPPHPPPGVLPLRLRRGALFRLPRPSTPPPNRSKPSNAAPHPPPPTGRPAVAAGGSRDRPHARPPPHLPLRRRLRQLLLRQLPRPRPRQARALVGGVVRWRLRRADVEGGGAVLCPDPALWFIGGREG